MKVQHSLLLRLLAALLTFGALASGTAATIETSQEFPYEVRYELGEAEFIPGDSITIQAVHGTKSVIATGETYCVEGIYTLGSREGAALSLYATSSNPNPTPVDPKQIVRVKKGTGSFRLIKTMNEEGYLHVSFYPVSSGSGFGGVYFGQGKWVLHNKGWSYLDDAARARDQADAGGPTTASLAGPNRALFEYLGDPVEPPANMNPAYSKDGLINAIQLAARNAGVSLKKVQIEDSEFPFLVGLVCEESDFAKLREQLKKMDGYDYGGSVSSHDHYALNIVPYRAFPSASERISRRLAVRQRMFYDRLMSQP